MYVTRWKNFVISYRNDCQPERSRKLNTLYRASNPLSLKENNLLQMAISLLFSKNQNDRFHLRLRQYFCCFLLDDAVQFRYD